jgi:plasmid stability protein
MASLTVRNIPEQVMSKLRGTAAERNRSLNAQAIRWLQDSANRQASERDWDRFLAEVRAAKREMRRRHGPGTDSAELIRQMREERTVHLLEVGEANHAKTGRRGAR